MNNPLLKWTLELRRVDKRLPEEEEEEEEGGGAELRKTRGVVGIEGGGGDSVVAVAVVAVVLSDDKPWCIRYDSPPLITPAIPFLNAVFSST